VKGPCMLLVWTGPERFVECMKVRLAMQINQPERFNRIVFIRKDQVNIRMLSDTGASLWRNFRSSEALISGLTETSDPWRGHRSGSCFHWCQLRGCGRR
jgi:hypothetical protein